MKLLRATISITAQECERMAQQLVAEGHDPDVVRREIARSRADPVYLSDCGTYQVAVREADNGFGATMVAISIRRVDREPVTDWRDMQAIKNAVVGEECEAIEIYPAESRLVDTANQRLLWAFVDPSVRLPVGFQ